MSAQRAKSEGTSLKTAGFAAKWLGFNRAGIAVLLALGLSVPLAAQQQASGKPEPPLSVPSGRPETTQDLNRKIARMVGRASDSSANSRAEVYQIGPEDLLDVSVLEAPDLSRTVRVSDDGAISLPLLGVVRAAGLTSRELESVLENLLRRTYMKDPQVSIFVREMRSHPVSIFGAVEKPGVYQIRGPKTLIEVLAMAQGLAADAGDQVIIMRTAGDPISPPRPAHPGLLPPSQSPSVGDPAAPRAAAAADPSAPALPAASPDRSIEISLKELLDSSSSRSNALVYPGDVVKVTRAGIVYVVGEVHKPGGFLLKTNENISVLQALALAEGLTPTARARNARIILAGASGSGKEIAINLDKILNGKASDPLLHSRDILFVPNSTRKSALQGLYRSVTGIIPAVSGASVYRW